MAYKSMRGNNTGYSFGQLNSQPYKFAQGIIKAHKY